MRRAYAHRAAVELDPAGDDRAPGAAVTAELCGHWEHEPPCPVAAHHTRAERRGDVVDLRVLFAAEPEREAEVRTRIELALRAGALTGPGGATTRWRLREVGPAVVADAEADHAERLTRS
ncbi:hypothetical protein [Pseudonocardia humida]|uniref:Uncharacterized protein n=1 Tax=Pseudonocardia humida TaxID=2800819 RepID=A0ABT0ZX47_9PSEU|nr:hypothetical protein [Pseudonocardia humida]MCO1655291.1 hypothetical protein [Pseudonocardia humida]